MTTNDLTAIRATYTDPLVIDSAAGRHSITVLTLCDEVERLREANVEMRRALGDQTTKNKTLLNRVHLVTRSRQRWVAKARRLGYVGPGPGDPTGLDPAGDARCPTCVDRETDAASRRPNITGATA